MRCRMGDAGKGDKRRPCSVKRKEFDSNWNRAFKKNGKKKKTT